MHQRISVKCYEPDKLIELLSLKQDHWHCSYLCFKFHYPWFK